MFSDRLVKYNSFVKQDENLKNSAQKVSSKPVTCGNKLAMMCHLMHALNSNSCIFYFHLGNYIHEAFGS